MLKSGSIEKIPIVIDFRSSFSRLFLVYVRSRSRAYFRTIYITLMYSTYGNEVEYIECPIRTINNTLYTAYLDIGDSNNRMFNRGSISEESSSREAGECLCESTNEIDNKNAFNEIARVMDTVNNSASSTTDTIAN